jgi:hypothetical protein
MRIISVLLLAILCFGCGGYSSPKAAAPQPGVVPAITQLVPNSAKSGDPAFTLTVNGSSFGTSAVVNWNGTNQTTTYVTAKQLTAAIAASAIAMPGTVPITVTNPATAGGGGPYGGGGTTAATSSAVNFTVN